MSLTHPKLLEDAMQDSWVDLGDPSSRSSAGSIFCTSSAAMFDVSSSNRGSRHSPKSADDPNLKVKPNLEAVKFKLVRESRDTDWLWDWSSRPEAVPPKHYRFRHPGGTMTTPPNSPRMSPGGTIKCSSGHYAFSLRHTKIIRNEFFSAEVLSLFIVSNVLSLCIGYWICRKLACVKLDF